MFKDSGILSPTVPSQLVESMCLKLMSPLSPKQPPSFDPMNNTKGIKDVNLNPRNYSILIQGKVRAPEKVRNKTYGLQSIIQCTVYSDPKIPSQGEVMEYGEA